MAFGQNVSRRKTQKGLTRKVFASNRQVGIEGVGQMTCGGYLSMHRERRLRGYAANVQVSKTFVQQSMECMSR